VLKPFGSYLALLPGSVDLANAAIRLIQGDYPLERLRDVLRQGHVEFDYVLIDTPPSLSVLTIAGLIAADEVLIPVQCDHSAMFGIRAIQDVVGRIRTDMGNPMLDIVGILPTLYDQNAVYASNVLNELHALLPDFVLNTVIPYDSSVTDAPHQGQVVVDYAPDSPASLAYQALANELLSR
jgi:chromosome partitioning protein